MEIVGMTEDDLNGIFIMEFPNSMSLDECRERMELEIYMYLQEDKNLMPEEIEMLSKISPINVLIALRRMDRRKPGYAEECRKCGEEWLKSRTQKQTH